MARGGGGGAPREVALATTAYDGTATGGVLARRLRIFLANATTFSAAGLPLLGVRALSLDACAYPRAAAAADAQLSYEVGATPPIT